jgi:hypothetical protein
VQSGGALQTIPDIIEIAVNSVMLHGGEIEVMLDHEGLAAAGNIGAELRY